MFVTIPLEKDHYIKSLEVHMRDDGSISINLMQQGIDPVSSILLSPEEERHLRNAIDFLGEFHG